MKTRENLEKRQSTLIARTGVLALERLNLDKRAAAIDEEMRQIDVLLKVLATTLDDAVDDEKELGKLEEKVKALAAKDEGNMNGDGDTESS